MDPPPGLPALFAGLVLLLVAVLVRARGGRALWARGASWGVGTIAAVAVVVGARGVLEHSAIGGAIGHLLWIEWGSETVLFLIAAWSITEALEIFFWDGWLLRSTGTAASRILRSLVAMAIYTVAALSIVAFVYEKSIAALLVSTGVVAAVIGLALQGILSDLLAGIAITFERPYRIGDWIETESDVWGRVVDINWRTTRVRSFNGGVYVLPNRKAAEMVIHNHSLGETRYGWWIDVKIQAEAPPADVRQVLLDALLACPSVLDEPLPLALISDAATRPYSYMIYVYFADYPGHWVAKDQMWEYVSKALADAGIHPAAATYEVLRREVDAPRFEPPSTLPQLRNARSLAPLSDHDVERLHRAAKRVRHRAGAHILRQGDPGDSLIVLTSGIAHVEIRLPSGDTTRVGELHVGSCVGEIALLTGEPRTASIVAATDVDTLEVDRADLRPLLDERPELYEAFALEMAKHRARDEGLAAEHEGQRSTLRAYAEEAAARLRRLFATPPPP